MLALPVAIRTIVDQGFLTRHSSAIDRYFLLLLVLVFIVAAFSAIRYYLVMWLGERIVADIRTAVYQHVLAMDLAFFEITRSGEVLSRLTADTTQVQSVFGAGVSIALRSSVLLIGSLVMLTITSPQLTGLILVLVPFVVLPLIFFGKKVRQLSRASQDCIGEASALAAETLNAISMIQSYTLEKYHGHRFMNAVETAFDTATRRLHARSLLTAFAILVIFSAIMLVIWIGIKYVLAEEMSIGELGQFIIYAVIVATSTAALSEIWGELQKAIGAMERLMELLNAKAQITCPKDPLTLNLNGTGEIIRFYHVCFHYPSRPNQHALSDFSLDVRSGETIALVGPSGAGKSTVFQLLLRFYDPQQGIIQIGNTNISRVDPRVLRQQTGIVHQETVIFASDVSENIRCGNPDASTEDIKNAAIAAVADDFINRLPHGYDSFLGERGVRLSGGQQQRIAIARAILKNPPILLLDEATSALDAESEKHVQEALEHLMKHRTTLVIAHRFATVLKADRIVVMDHGRIIAIGRHAELMKQGGLYARLAELQFAKMH